MRTAHPVLGAVRVMIGPNILVPWAAVVAALVPEALAPAPVERDALHQRLLPLIEELGAVSPPWPDIAALGAAETLALLIAWFAAALQNVSGARVPDHAVARGPDGTLHAACGYRDRTVGRAAMMVAGHVLAAARDPGWRGPAASLRTAIANVVDLGRRAHDDRHTGIAVERAAARGIPVYRVVPDHAIMQLGQGIRQHNFLRVMGSRSEYVGSMLCDKQRSHAVLERLGLPVARQRVVGSPEAARRAAREIGGPVVIKPSFGDSGLGVTVGISDPAEIARAYRKAAEAGAGRVLVESFEEGDDFRLVLIDGELVAAARRVPAHVVGNGRNTVAELVALANRDPRRGSIEQGELVHLALDDEADRLLAARGHGRDSIPGEGEVVVLRATANVSTGGTAEDVIERVHPAVRRLAEIVARAFRLEIVGIDYLTPDISRSPEEVGGVVCEVNRSPGLRPHAPAVQAAIVDRLLDRYFGRDGDGRIPVATVTAASGAVAVSEMVAAMIEASGLVAGIAGPDGVVVGGRTLHDTGDPDGVAVAQMPFFDPTTEAAVIAVGRDEILRHGLPVDRADVVAVLDVSADAAVDGPGRAEAVAVAAARRVVVLDADDAASRVLAATATVPVVWTSLHADNAAVSAHVRAGGTAVRVAGEGADVRIVLDRAGARSDVASGLVPTPAGGLRAAVAAVAIAVSLGVPLEAVAAGLARCADRNCSAAGQ